MSEQHADHGTNRRKFLGQAAVGAGAIAGAGGLQAVIPGLAAAKSSGPTAGDVKIVSAAEIAEALAVTTYTNIIDSAPFFSRLPADDQGYLVAARQEEKTQSR